MYTFDGYGAFVINIGGDFKHISDLKKSYDEVLKCNPFHKILDMMNEGYEFCFGPAFPSKNGYINDHLVGLYCKNYVEMAQKELSL